ncbi:MAG: hypothetical protein M1354_03970 [Candidatus Marsarchaeota archaeon]|jgi:ZIP family zinc transporter|nr:hypothetical protein [Candidatus Marsarchaeota archaeon]
MAINAYVTIGLSFVIGLAVFASLPIVLHKRIKSRHMLFFSSVAIGILVFLLVDIYGDVAALYGNSPQTPSLEALFIIGFVIAFLFLIYPRASRDPVENPKRTSVLAALGIGFQNLTEGLVFGSAGAAGIVSIYLVSLIGFALQNVTEGFPIAAPLVGSKVKIKKRFIASVFLLGGLPTIAGTLIGLVYYSAAFIVLFDALASAAILYVVLVLFHVNLKRSMARKPDISVFQTYFGIMLGFAIAFIVNYI